MKRARRAGAVSLLTAVVLLSCSCKTNSGYATEPNAVAASQDHFYSVATKSTGFFHYSPSQEVGPDKFLPRDTVLKVTRPSFVYSRVQLMNDQEGYVASKDLRVAPPELVAKATAAQEAAVAKEAAARKIEPPPQPGRATPTVQIPTARSTGVEPTPLPTPR
jgi:hypothetical protein